MLHILRLSYRHAGEMNTLHNELQGLKELLHTYEVSIERKDGVIANLTRSLQNQKQKCDTMRTFADWKIQMAASKQQVSLGHCISIVIIIIVVMVMFT